MVSQKKLSIISSVQMEGLDAQTLFELLGMADDYETQMMCLEQLCQELSLCADYDQAFRRYISDH